MDIDSQDLVILKLSCFHCNKARGIIIFINFKEKKNHYSKVRNLSSRFGLKDRFM